LLHQSEELVHSSIFIEKKKASSKIN